MLTNSCMDVLWMELALRLPESLTDYPASLARDSIAGALIQLNILLNIVTPEQAIAETKSEPQIILFSATSAEWPKVVSVASEVRAVSPHSVLVVGGHHVSALPYCPGTELFDYIIVGEGEQILREILPGLAGVGLLLRKIQEPQVLRAERISSLEALPPPLRNLTEIQKNRLQGLMVPPPSKQTGSVALLLSRGCNNRCTFCASHNIWGSKLISKSVEAASLEVKMAVDELGCNAMVLVDQSFGEDEKWTREMCTRLQQYGVPKKARWYCMAKTSLPHSLLGDMAGAGCSKIGFGVETAETERREMLKRAKGATLNKLNQLFRRCNELGILVKVYFIIGFPWETPDYLLETTKWFLENIEANELKISYFTPFPGTEDWLRYKNQLITKDFSDFDTVSMPVVYNPLISVSEYHKIKSALFRSFYGSTTYSKGVGRMLEAYPDYTQSYREFAEHVHHFDMVPDNALWTERVRHAQDEINATMVAVQ